MNLAFLLPAAFAALAALLVPLLIHLARRSEQRPTAFAALRWLRARPKPRHRLRFDEWPLLLLRLLLLVALALLLARPVLYDGASHAPYVAVVPGVDLQAVADMDAGTDTRRHWLAPGFPSLDQAPPAGAWPVMSLLRELDAALPADVALTVLVPAQLEGVDAQRPRLGRRVAWRVVPGAMAPRRIAPAAPQRALAVRYAADRADAVHYLRAAHAAWQAPASPDAAAVFDAAPAASPLQPQARTLAWLVPGPLPAHVRDWIARGGVAVLDAGTVIPEPPPMSVQWQDDLGVPIVEGGALGRGRVLRLTRPLSPLAMPQLLEADFPHRLQALLAVPAAAPARVLAAAHAPASGGPLFPQPPRELQSWLLWCIALLFLLERWFASSARRGGAP